MPENNIFLALSNPVEGRDDDFHRWYAYHVVEVPEFCLGFMRGQRYWLSTVQRTGEGVGRQPQFRSLAIYQLDPAADVAAIHEDVITQHGRFTQFEGVLDPYHVAWTYAPLGPRVAAPRPNALPGTHRHVFLALTNPVEGREDEFNEWYDEAHVPEILAEMPGFASCRRFRLHEHQRKGESPPWRYLALYELEGDDLEAIHRGDAEVRLGGKLTPNGGTLDRTDFAVWVYTAVTPTGEIESRAPSAVTVSG